MKVFVIINSIMLAVVTIFIANSTSARWRLSYLSARDIWPACRGLLKKMYINGLKRADRKTAAAQDKKPKKLLERMELQFIIKSNLNRVLPIINIRMLFLASILIFIAAIGPLAALLSFLPSAMILSGFFASMPFIVLDAVAKYNSEKTGKKMAELISVLNRWYSVKEDIMHAFAKAAVSGIGEPLQTYFNEMAIRVNSGMDPCEAIDLMEIEAGNSQFTEFLINIRHNIRCKGDMKRLLTNMEYQAYKISEEFSRRRISTFRDRVVIYCAMAVVLVSAYFFISFDARVAGFYLETIQGKLLLTVFMFLYALGTAVALNITRFRY